jgi:hypothetical protein
VNVVNEWLYQSRFISLFAGESESTDATYWSLVRPCLLKWSTPSLFILFIDEIWWFLYKFIYEYLNFFIKSGMIAYGKLLRFISLKHSAATQTISVDRNFLYFKRICVVYTTPHLVHVARYYPLMSRLFLGLRASCSCLLTLVSCHLKSRLLEVAYISFAGCYSELWIWCLWFFGFIGGEDMNWM